MILENAREILEKALFKGGKVKESISSVVSKADLASKSFDHNYTIVAAGTEIHQSIMTIIKK